MKLRIITVLLIAMLTSCMSSKKLTGYVETKIQTPTSQIAANPNIAFDFSHLAKSDKPVVSTNLKSQLIPALLFWKWDKRIQCNIDPTIIAELFKERFLHTADSLQMNQILAGRNLDLTIESIPSSFEYRDLGNTIIFVVAYSVTSLEAIIPESTDLRVTYKLHQDGKTLKEGQVTAINDSKPISNVWKTPKGFAWKYIEHFKQSVYSMSDEIVRSLFYYLEEGQSVDALAGEDVIEQI